MNINSYIKKFGKLTFEEFPLNDVDALIFAEFAYINVDLLIGERFAKIKNLNTDVPDIVYRGSVDWKYNRTMLKLMKESNRYKDLSVGMCRNIFLESKKLQFFALTILLPNNEMMICYRGTDTSLVGWEEDFLMTYGKSLPSEKQSLTYLYDVLSRHSGRRFYLNGHSKGGYLSFYVALHMRKEFHDRLIYAYSFDGPGFTCDLDKLTNYPKLKEKLLKYMTFNDIIGLLFTNIEQYKVVYSSGILFGGHDPFFWQVNSRKGSFAFRKEIAKPSLKNNKKVMAWLNSLTNEEKELGTEAIFTLLDNCESIYDIPTKGISNITNFKKILGDRYSSDELKRMRAFIDSLLKYLVFYTPEKNKQLKNNIKNI